MANSYKIDCINKREHYDPYTRISHIGGKLDDGNRYRVDIDQAISQIEAGKWSFYVQSGSSHTDVEVALSANKNKYLRTVSNKTTLDNLLSLSECAL